MGRWLEVTRTEPDGWRRADYGAYALILSELPGRREAWKQALEGWEVTESQQVLEWIALGEAKGEARGEARGEAKGQVLGELKGKVSSLLRLLELRFPPGPPADLQQRIRGTADLTVLDRWLDAACVTNSLDEFRRATQT